jgi:hypothetical protein
VLTVLAVEHDGDVVDAVEEGASFSAFRGQVRLSADAARDGP